MCAASSCNAADRSAKVLDRLRIVAAQAASTDYLHEVDHGAERIVFLERAIDEAIETAPPTMRAVMQALQALRGVAKVTAVSVVAEVGIFSRFDHPRQLMGYSGAVPSEQSSGGPTKQRRGPMTKSGNSHLRRVVVESAWSYRHRPGLSYPIRRRHKDLSPQVK